MVGEGPQNTVSLRVGEEFVLLVGRPEVMVRGNAVVDLDGGLVVLRDEYRGVITHGLADPNVVVVVGVFYDLNRGPSGGCRIIGLFRNRG